jgi:hypothetical protein
MTGDSEENASKGGGGNPHCVNHSINRTALVGFEATSDLCTVTIDELLSQRHDPLRSAPLFYHNGLTATSRV